MNSSPRTRIAAQTISLIGHPAAIMPLAVILISYGNRTIPRAIIITVIAISAAVLLYSFNKTRSGQWFHMDASMPEERFQLNWFLGIILFIGASVAIWLQQPPMLYLGITSVGVLITTSLLLRRWLKASLHVGFAAFTTILLWPNWLLMSCLLLLTLAIAWSRLVLSRHKMLDVVVGALLGAIIGIVYVTIMTR